MNGWENDIWIKSSLKKSGMRSSRTSPCSLAISLAHKKKFQTSPSSAIGDNHRTEKKRNEDWRKEMKHKKIWKFTFRHPASYLKNFPDSKFPDTFSYHAIPISFPNSQTKLFFQQFCSTAVGLLSSRNNFVSKRKRNQKLTVKNF